PEVHGYGMVAYSGGRSEVRIRLHPTEVLYYDFKSQYATVNALIGIQDLLLAKEVRVRDVTAEVQALLAACTLDQLQDPAFWRRRGGVVRTGRGGALLPVRAEYGRGGRNLGEVYVVSGPPIWHALADVLASTLRTGRVPAVLEALELVPSAER